MKKKKIYYFGDILIWIILIIVGLSSLNLLIFFGDFFINR